MIQRFLMSRQETLLSESQFALMAFIFPPRIQKPRLRLYRCINLVLVVHRRRQIPVFRRQRRRLVLIGRILAGDVDVTVFVDVRRLHVTSKGVDLPKIPTANRTFRRGAHEMVYGMFL